MDSDILLKPSSKKRPLFERKYPFPIFIPKEQSPSDHDDWKCITANITDGCILVSDEKSIKMLYAMGFYGKSTLTKSEPQACSVYLKAGSSSRKNKKSEIEESSEDESAKEEQDKEADVEIEVVDSNEPAAKKRKKSTEIEVLLSGDSSSSDSDSGNEETTKQVEVKEELQLMFEEAFFLSYALGCLVVKDKNQPLDLIRLWHKLCELSLDDNFPVMYTAYHHFRGKGWVVRSGLKYGCDYVLYKDGPPFYHSTYAVIVKAVKEKQLKVIDRSGTLTWSSLAALNRINSHAAKGVMFLYVIKPDMISENKISTPFCVSQFKIQEVLVKRWVPSESREENT